MDWTERLERPAGSTRLYRVARKAAVAVVLRERGTELELLLVRRARRPGDPWSGDMAFPGGRLAQSDADDTAAAVRETREEVGIDLHSAAEPVGGLPRLWAPAHNRPWPMAITPVVFRVTEEVAPRPNAEIEESVWVPLRFFIDRSNRQTFRKWLLVVPKQFPCYRYQGRLVWGLTLQMIDALVARVDQGVR